MKVNVGEEIATSRQFEKDVSVLTRCQLRIEGGDRYLLTCIPRLLRNGRLGLG